MVVVPLGVVRRRGAAGPGRGGRGQVDVGVRPADALGLGVVRARCCVLAVVVAQRDLLARIGVKDARLPLAVALVPAHAPVLGRAPARRAGVLCSAQLLYSLAEHPVCRFFKKSQHLHHIYMLHCQSKRGTHRVLISLLQLLHALLHSKTIQ